MMKNIRASAWAGITAIISVVFMTILSEESAGFKDLLTKLATHHWIGKSILSIVVFIISYAISTKRLKDDETAAGKYAIYIAVSALIGACVLFGFFLFEMLSG